MAKFVSLFVCWQYLVGIFDVWLGFPWVISGWIVFPLDKVLIPSTDLAVIKYHLNFIFFFTINKVRRWVGEAWSVDIGLSEWWKECGMEHIVNFPTFQNIQSISEGSQDFHDFEGSFSFWCKFLWISHFQILSIQPDLISLPEWFSGSPSSMGNTERSRSLFGPRCIPRRAGDRQYTVGERKFERDDAPTLGL